MPPHRTAVTFRIPKPLADRLDAASANASRYRISKVEIVERGLDLALREIETARAALNGEAVRPAGPSDHSSQVADVLQQALAEIETQRADDHKAIFARMKVLRAAVALLYVGYGAGVMVWIAHHFAQTAPV